MDINDDVLSMPCGWIIQYNDGSMITEYDRNGVQRNWRTMSKNNIRCLSLKWHTKHWTVSGKDVYLQKKRGWVSPGLAEQEANIQYRYIGYWEGSNKVYYRVDELSGTMTMSVETIEK